MATDKPNFRIGSVVDPTRGAMQGLQAAQGNLSNIMKIHADEEARQRQARLDAQNTALFNLKMEEAERIKKDREANLNFLSELSKPKEARYGDGDITNRWILNKDVLDKEYYLTPDELKQEQSISDKTKLPDHIKAKLAAQAALGDRLVAKAKLANATESQRIQDIFAKSDRITPEMYARLDTVKAAEAANVAAQIKATQEEIKAKEKYAQELGLKLADASVIDQGWKTGSSSSKSNDTKSANDWADSKTNPEEFATDLSPWLLGGEDEDMALKMIGKAKALGLSKKETMNILEKARIPGGENIGIDNRLINPVTGKSEDAEKWIIGEFVKALSRNQNTGSGGTYLKKDRKSQQKLLQAEKEKNLAEIVALRERLTTLNSINGKDTRREDAIKRIDEVLKLPENKTEVKKIKKEQKKQKSSELRTEDYMNLDGTTGGQTNRSNIEDIANIIQVEDTPKPVLSKPKISDYADNLEGYAKFYKDKAAWDKANSESGVWNMLTKPGAFAKKFKEFTMPDSIDKGVQFIKDGAVGNLPSQAAGRLSSPTVTNYSMPLPGDTNALEGILNTPEFQSIDNKLPPEEAKQAKAELLAKRINISVADAYRLINYGAPHPAIIK